jgi:primosomal protein N'
MTSPMVCAHSRTQTRLTLIQFVSTLPEYYFTPKVVVTSSILPAAATNNQSITQSLNQPFSRRQSTKQSTNRHQLQFDLANSWQARKLSRCRSVSQAYRWWNSITLVNLLLAYVAQPQMNSAIQCLAAAKTSANLIIHIIWHFGLMWCDLCDWNVQL